MIYSQSDTRNAKVYQTSPEMRRETTLCNMCEQREGRRMHIRAVVAISLCRCRCTFGFARANVWPSKRRHFTLPTTAQWTFRTSNKSTNRPPTLHLVQLRRLRLSSLPTSHTRRKITGFLIRRPSRTGSPQHYETHPTSHCSLLHSHPIHTFPTYSSTPSDSIFDHPARVRTDFHRRWK